MCIDPPLPFDMPPWRPVTRQFHVSGDKRPTHKLGDDTLDRSAAEDGSWVATVGSDDTVVAVDRRLHTDVDGLLQRRTRQRPFAIPFKSYAPDR
jgi:hypothetical protein